jgi:hypothetical protein
MGYHLWMMGAPTPRWHISDLGTPAKTPFYVFSSLTGRGQGDLFQFRSDLVQICALHPCHLPCFPAGLPFLRMYGLVKKAFPVRGAGVTDI